MTIKIKTKGHYHFLNITKEIRKIVKESKIKNGIVFLFVKHTTCALFTIEDEQGHKKDLKDIFEKIAPENAEYCHHLKWGDHNGAAHIKGAILKPDLLLPFKNKELELGTWQEIFLIDFDEKPREREIVVKIIKTEE